MSKKPIMRNEPEIPAEFKLKYAIKNAGDKLKEEHVALRILVLNPVDGSISFIENNTSIDWKSERNARAKADWINEDPSIWGFPKGSVAVVRKCKVTAEEIV